MSRTVKPRIIQGGKATRNSIGSIEVVPATTEAQPFPVAARIYEEDTWQIMSNYPIPHKIETHPIRIMTDLIDQQPLKAGDVLVRGNQWLALVYDLDQEPICNPDWIASALQKILALADQKRITALGLPLLGSEHGPLSGSQSLEIIINALHSFTGSHLQKVWLIVKDDQQQNVQQMINASAHPVSS